MIVLLFYFIEYKVLGFGADKSNDWGVMMSIKILIADDSDTLRMELKTIFKDEGYTLLEACDGREAIKALEQNLDVSIVFSDLNMPNTSGMDLLKWVRAQEQLAKTPFCFLSAISSKETISEGNKLGANAWIIKPPHKDSLKKFVHRLIEKHNLKAS